MRSYLQFINGKLVPGLSDTMIEVENPSTGKIMAHTPNGGREDAMAALEAATRAQSGWAALPSAARAEYLKKFAAVIRRHRQDLGRILAEEQAKTHPLAQVELLSAGNKG